MAGSANLSLLKQVKGIRFDTLAAICHYLDCQPGDILGFQPGTWGWHRDLIAMIRQTARHLEDRTPLGC